MIYTKNHLFTSLIVATIALTPTISTTIELPAQIKNASIYLRQRAAFAKAMSAALWKHAHGDTNQHTIIEEKLAKRYATKIANNNVTHDALALRAALKNNAFTADEKFFLGASTSDYQISGGNDGTSAAARFYAAIGLPTAGDAIDFYNRYKSDAKQLKEELNINAYRISIPWNRVEPQQGIFDKEEIEHCRDVIRTFLAQGIKPMVTFYHYDAPTWFEDLRGFELQENGKLYQRLCLTIYRELAEELGDCFISMCCAPEGSAFKGYFTGQGTPGEKDNLHKTHTVIANMYYEIVDTALAIQQEYDLMKHANPALKKPFIGTQINVIPLDPHPSSQKDWSSRFFTNLGCAMAQYVQSGGTFNFLVNGHYCMYTPDAEFMKKARGANVYRYHPRTAQAFDWIGVNIYSNGFLNGFDRITGDKLIETDEERYTDNPNYRNYPEGIYRAVQLITENLAIPLGKLKNKNGEPLKVIVTENGIATKDDAQRTRYFQRAIATITELVADGYPVIGYLPWTSHDNYEWPTHEKPDAFNSRCYGFFAVNFDKNSPDYLKRTLKEGSRYYADFAKIFLASA